MLDCHRGGYINLRHDKTRDFLFKKSASIYNDSETEPKLQPVSGEELAIGANAAQEARADIRIRGHNRELRNTFLDIKVINLTNDTHAALPPTEALKKAEAEKDNISIE